jgi:UDP-N-acetylmuramyl pentapeptide phosphotransferase/UDP-N-acetylglucosamine-1-phosphate transferase
VALTLFWVVGMMNSINMLDNMDGITTFGQPSPSWSLASSS